MAWQSIENISRNIKYDNYIEYKFVYHCQKFKFQCIRYISIIKLCVEYTESLDWENGLESGSGQYLLDQFTVGEQWNKTVFLE